jgi:Ca-activated chloride channel family protein
MRKFAALSLLLSLFAASTAPLYAQSRARRVGTPPAPAPSRPATAPTPLPRSTTPRPPAAAQQPRASTEEEVGEDEVVRVNTALVPIPVSVLDRDGRFISGLRKEDFRIFEDGVEQEVAYFAAVEQPFTVALVLDTSGSTRFKLNEIHEAAVAFLDQLRPEDRVLVVSFDSDVRLLSPPTSDRRLLRDAVRRARVGGGTRLYDAVEYVFKQLSRISGRKAVVLFTDGVDTESKRASYQGTLADAEELDALVYPVQYDTFGDMQGGGGGGWPGPPPVSTGGILGDILGGIILGGRIPRGGRGGGGAGTSREDYRRATEYLRSLAFMTGGRHHDASDRYNLERAFTNIAEELRRQYSLGYYPARQSNAAERRQIKVRVKRPNLVVRARDSYLYKPTSPAGNTAQEAAPQQRPAPELRRRQFNETMSAKRRTIN